MRDDSRLLFHLLKGWSKKRRKGIEIFQRNRNRSNCVNSNLNYVDFSAAYLMMNVRTRHSQESNGQGYLQ
jgi:hypothetical protein